MPLIKEPFEIKEAENGFIVQFGKDKHIAQSAAEVIQLVTDFLTQNLGTASGTADDA